MYRRLPKVSLPMHDVVESMVRVKWDSKEMPERHSEYVDVIHRRFLELLDGLEQMRMLAIVSDDSLRAIILRGAVLHVMEVRERSRARESVCESEGVGWGGRGKGCTSYVVHELFQFGLHV